MFKTVAELSHVLEAKNTVVTGSLMLYTSESGVAPQ